MKCAGIKTGFGWLGVFFWLLSEPAIAQQGLKGEYYNGSNFEKKILTRIDPELRFSWKSSSPASGLDYSYYSIRWTGKILAPASGRYTFYAKVDDGIRVWVGNRKVMDVWQLNDSNHFTGTVVLEAGRYYDLKVEYFNAMLGGVLELFWQRPDPKAPLSVDINRPMEPIAARYFRQQAPPVAASPQPAALPPVSGLVRATPPKPVVRPPVLATVKSVKPAPKSVKPASARPVPPVTAVQRPVPLPASSSAAVARVVPRNEPPASESVIATPVTLRHVQFEQSSYVLLPESFPELDKLVERLRQQAHWRIEVMGHTDNVGDPRLNQVLSEYRAKVVMNYLIRHGIADDRIEANGYGGSRPIAGNDTEDGRSRNRRVEFILK
ncbi:PA14 domain-containing protein [Spirosoma sp. 209]|uniref:PA14 domain-containing protein n=1 Tax=Spirosoma sp. 209 TaxID=1955701 RepID=UPI00098D6FA7|nr:PA14 domain-containing protein [Spirosoma sp. 209]